jgi:hypothetical protein
MENYNDFNVENICGYTVYSYEVEAPHAPRKTHAKRKNMVFRCLAFAFLAPFALMADAMVAMFN